MKNASKQVNGKPGRNGNSWRPGMPFGPFGRSPGRGTSAPDESTKPLAEMAERGDFAGVLSWLRDRSVLEIPPGALDYLAKAIRRSQANLDDLIDGAFAEIIGFTLVLVTRCELHVERRLAEADGIGGDPTHLPVDLDSDGWLERIERIARFLMELTTARSRVRHISRLNNDAKRSNDNLRWFNSASPMDFDRVQASRGQGPPRNGRGHRKEGRIVFP